MRTTDLTSSTLAALRRRRPYPAVTVTFPTDRRATPATAQNAVRLRNMVAEARRRLEADPDVSREARYDIGEQLEKAAAEVESRFFGDSLAIFAAQGEHQVWYLPRPAPERVVFSDTFLTRNLVAARERTRPYWVLTVAADRTTLWGGSNGNLQEEQHHGFPATPPSMTPDVEREERTGDVPGPFGGENARMYLRQVDASIEKLLGAEPRPLYLIGATQALALLDDVGNAAKAAVAKVVKGGLANGPASALTEAVAQARAEQAEKDTARVLARLDQARGRKACAAGLEEVWQVAKEGRIDMLVVEEGYQRTVRVTEEHLVPVDPAETSLAELGTQVQEDIVDEIIETALDTGSEVVFLPDGALADHDHIVAALRF
ncbi:chemotaxis protein [Streptomyces pactum]|uniref:Chemotaxis protein n=1 Tax=Streptomyces pactum TaxID=68249 RepID=A0ABS0NR38_9ACTN|nr:chemotaxis protein [Streptomyces pactum]MBH5337504.1 chemotaxis protein [Streptomyces pactum]